MVPVEMLGGNASPANRPAEFPLTLAPYGFLLVRAGSGKPDAQLACGTGAKHARLHFGTENAWKSYSKNLAAPAWNIRHCPPGCPSGAGFAGKIRQSTRYISYGVRFGDPQHPVLLSEIEVTSAGLVVSCYQLPLGFLGEDPSLSPCPSNMLARATHPPGRFGDRCLQP